MNRGSYVTVLLAVCCIGAVGISSTTLDSSLSQEPDDVVDLDYSKLPIGEDQGKSFKDALQNDEAGSASGGSGGDGSSESSAAGESNEASSSSASSEQQSDASADSAAASESNEGSSGASTGAGPAEIGSLSLLYRLLQLLKALLPLLALLALLALAYRYRRQLAALGALLFGGIRESTGGRRADAADWPSERPSTEVHRAWLSMVDRVTDRVDVDRPWTQTPYEWSDAALRADLDPTAVETLTDLFEEVRYGDQPVTDERRRRAREGVDRLDGVGARVDGGTPRDDEPPRDGGGSS